MTAIMEGVVERGTAKTAQIEGYTIAAKTGTAAKLDNGAYSKQKYNSSIVGFFPSRKPAVTVLVVIDTPRVGGYYGGVVAGPVFKRIAEAAIQHIGLPRSINPEAPVMVARQSDATGDARWPSGPTPCCRPARRRARDGVMPDLRGLSARSGRSHAGARRLHAATGGSGRRHRAGPDGRHRARPRHVGSPLARPRTARSARGFGRPAMTVAELLEALVQPALLSAPPVVPDAVGSTTVTAVVYDSRRAVPGAVFVALRGQKDDGARFAPQAVARGAVLVVAETPAPAGHQGAWVTVPDARLALALLADRFHGHPSGTLRVVGITGTNGKTTTAYLLRSILEAAGQRCGLLGTVVYSLGREDREATRTTPEAPDVQQMFREMVDNGCAAAVMEVSSHALALKRVDGVAVCGRRLQQPDARPPRLPRRHGDVFRRQAPAVRDAAGRRAGRRQRRRPEGTGPGGHRPAGRSPTASATPPTSRPSLSTTRCRDCASRPARRAVPCR